VGLLVGAAMASFWFLLTRYLLRPFIFPAIRKTLRLYDFSTVADFVSA